MAYKTTGVKTVVTAGTAVPLLLPDNAAGHNQQVFRAQTIIIQNTSATGSIAIGDKTVVASTGVGVGMVLAPGVISPSFQRTNGGEDTSQLYVDGPSGSTFCALLIAD